MNARQRRERGMDMKTRKYMTPLLSAIAASMLCANIAAAVSAHGIYQKFDTDGWGQPIISVLMQGLSHHGSAWEPADRDAKDSAPALLASSQLSTGEIPEVLAGQPESPVSVSVSGSGSGGQHNPGGTGSGGASAGQQSPGTDSFGNNSDGQQATGNGQQGSGAGSLGNGSKGQEGSGETVPGNGQQAAGTTASGSGQQGSGTGSSGNGSESNANGRPNPDADSTNNSSANVQNTNPAVSDAPQNPDSAAQTDPVQYAFTEVTQDYFDDALFIGDSRVTGVALYSGWDNLTYYAEGGMTIYNMLQSKTAQVDGQTLSIEEALQKRSFGKIYLEIGINEMGTGTADTFMEAYEAAVARLQELQPDAIIYVCGIMYVEQSKSESDPIFNNPAIQERNERIAQLADGESIFYLDINEVVTDETGNLNPDYTWDEVHLLGKYDVLWLEYFSSHGITKDNG